MFGSQANQGSLYRTDRDPKYLGFANLLPAYQQTVK